MGEGDGLSIEAQLGIGLVQLAKGETERAVATLERARTLAAAIRTAPKRVAEIDFALARALAGARERSRAIELARAARAGYERAGKAATTELAEVDRWLQQHSADG